MKWAVEIQKTSLERRNLADLLDDLGFSLINGTGFPLFTSPFFEDCSTADEVFEIAKQLRSAFKGATQIDSQFTLGSVLDYSTNPPKSYAFLEVDSIFQNTSFFGSATLTVHPPNGLSDQELKIWRAEQTEREYQYKLEDQRSRLEPAFWSLRAKKVLELLAIEHPSGEILYKIYELAEGHPNNNNRKTFQAQFGISTDQFKRFGDAVHNPEVSGNWARHGYKDKPKTTNPMSKDEAECFIRQIARQWLGSVRVNKSDS